MNIATTARSLSPYVLSVLRIMAGLAFLEHGTGKILGFPHNLPFVDQMPTGMLYFTGIIELVGGALLVLGLFTRPVAFVLSGFMAVQFMGLLARAELFQLHLLHAAGDLDLRAVVQVVA
jgi:putative oxidoreductase